MGPADAIELTKILHDYGPWGILVIFLAGIIAMWIGFRKDIQRLNRQMIVEREKYEKLIADERTKREADARGFHMAQIQNVRDLGEREKAFNETIRVIAGRK